MMGYEPILLGTSRNDGTGDVLQDGGAKINLMCAELYGRLLSVLQLGPGTSFTPDVSVASVVVLLLNGNASVFAPALPVAGQTVTFVVQQDGIGGRTVTWDGSFAHAWSDAGNAATKRSAIRFAYTGALWVQASAQSPYY